MYELEVPPNTKPGSKLKLTIPGMTEKVVITVPEGAEPGRTISFTLPKNKSAVETKLLEQTKAATAIQARLRGKAARQVTRSKIEVAAPSSEAVVPPTAAAAAEVEYAPNFPVSPAPPAPAAAAVAVAPPPPPKVEEPGFFGGLLQKVGALFGGFQEAPPEPAVEAPSAVAFELGALAARAITAWETADFDTFAALADPGVTVSLPGASASGMTEVWAARGADQVGGMLSIDTVMAQVDDEGDSATVVAIEHTHEVDSHGMPASHSWLRIVYKKVAIEAAAASAASAPVWKLTELMRDPIWPPPVASQAHALPPEEFRLGQGRTLGACSDVASLTAVALTSWIAGDKTRFELAVAPEVTMAFKALGLEASGVAACWEGRSKMLPIGTLIAVNSPMIDSDARGNASVLAHAHLYDVASAESSGRPTAHFALRLDFKGHMLLSVVGDVIWVDEERVTSEYETEGLAFDNPSVQSIYTRALTFVKAWETHADESLRALTSPSVQLEVPRYKIESSDIDALLKYRSTLETVGMLTVDSVRVAPSKFEAYLHEYGVEAAQHGLPRMHAGFVLEFARDDASKEMKVHSLAAIHSEAPKRLHLTTRSAALR